MKIRPLCIDYHLRAQEIIATERDICARRAALRSLPNPSPPQHRQQCRHRHWNSDADADGVILRPSSGDASSNDDENEFRSTSRDVVTTGEGGNDEPMTMRQAGERPDRLAPDAYLLLQSKSAEMGAIIGSDSLERQQERICKIIHTLGPAVLPSECALRPVTPVAKGPVRGHKLHISPPLLTTPLEALTKLYSNLMDKRMDAVIAALESGRWRLGSDSSIDYDEVLGLASSEDVTVNRRPRDTTFLDTMKINYSDSTSNIDGSETSLKSRIWTQHILDLPMPEPARYLRHEPDDPTTIYRLKSPRLSETSSFVSNVTKLFGPHLRAPKNLRQDERLDNRIKYATGRFIYAVSTKPEFPLKFYDISHVRKEEDYSMRLGIVPFTKFLDHDDIGTSNQNVLPLETRPKFTIRLDPDYDPLHPISSKRLPTTRELLIPLNKMCNMASVFRLPTRFEESHPLSNGLSRFATHQSHNRFEFTTNMLNALKESMANDQSMESFLAIHEKRASMNGIHILPQKIWLETDIETPLFGHEVKEKSNATKRPAWSTSDTNFFSRIMSFITPPNTSKKDGSESDENSSRRRFVPSSSPVMGSTVLENVTNYNKPTCIFLPQSIVQNDSTTECVARKSCQPSQQKLTSSAIVSAIRSGNMDWLQGNCSTYPVAFWFGNEMEINSDVKTMTELDANLLSVKRKSFCLNAKARSMFDGSYTLLLTGCSSRRNAESVYSYRGFLTNQIVDPNVFKHRYSASLRMVKLFSLQSKRTMCVEASIGVPAPEYEIFFTRMILSLLAKSFIHHDVTSKKTNQDGELTRKAPYSYSLTTSRHGQRHKSPCKSTGAKRTLHYVGPKFHLDVSKIEELAAHFSGECPGGAADIDDGDLDDVIAVEDLGKSSLKVRGELLHLVMKACELEDGKRTFLAEFATANRGRRSSKHITLEGVGDDSEIHEVAVPSGPQIAVTVDPIVLDEKTSMGKRVSEVPIDESKSRKKRKKEKKKKKSKKSRKRKRREDDSQKESRLRETTATSHAEHDKKPNNHTMRVAVPSIPIGMTPIHPPKKLELRRKALDSEHCKPRDGMTYSIDDAHESSNQTSTSAAVDTSPDSVANLNPVHTTIGIECNNYQPDCYPEAHTAEDTQLQTEEESMSDDQCIYTHESSLLTNNLNKLERPPWTLLTSESFLESYGEVIAELASGSWHKSLLKSETHIINDAPKEVVVCDCPLLDITGADVELADNSAVLVQYLSTWSGKADNSHSVSVHHGSRAFMRRLVLLAASGRYSAIHVVLCLDVEMSAALSGDIITVQNAVNQQSGCPAEHVTFEFVAPRSLATSIALKLTSVSNPQDSCQLSEFILDENVRERARFLVMLVPTMTVHMAMRCLGYGSSEINSGEAMHNLFVLATTTQRDLFPRTMEGMLSANASEQLWSALNVDIAHAY